MKLSGLYFDVAVFSSKGVPTPWAELSNLMVLDMDFMPAFEHRPMIITIGYGAVRLPAPDGPFAICLPLDVEGFGHNYVYADNAGKGYIAKDVSEKRLNLSIEAAESRLAAVKRAEKQYRKDGTQPSSDYSNRIAKAEALLKDVRAKKDNPVQEAKLAMASLCESLHAGEMLVLEHAEARIKSQPKRKDFKFGCNGFKYLQLGEKYAKLFSDMLNYITAPFYRRRTEPEEGARDFSNIERIVKWAERDGLDVKGHPLIWLHDAGTPNWLKDRNYKEVLDTHLDYINDAVTRFRGKINLWDIINEAHDWNNIHRWEYDKLIEITGLAADATKKANPEAFRVVNCCFTWSEYVATGWGADHKINRQSRSTIQYCRDLIDAGVDFEAIGLQLYDPSRDMFEINRHIDMFCKLGKKVHITELGISSSPEIVIKPDKVYVPNPMLWHGRPWSEKEQADWVEAFYTICYSKPAMEAITWWDFCDPSFIPHGGLVDEKLKPKESYRRLKKLIDSLK